MNRLMVTFLCSVLLLYSPAVCAQGKETGEVGTERQEEQRRMETARRVSEEQRGLALVQQGKLVVEPFFEYNHISGTNVSISGFTIFQAILIGQVTVQKLKRDLFIPGITFRGGFKNFEAYVRIPWLFRNDTLVFPRSGSGTSDLVERSFSDNSLGDITSYLYYHLLREGQWRPWVPDTIVRVGFSAPTGQAPYDVKRRLIKELGAIIPVEFPTGTGHWGLAVGSTFVRSADPAVIFANVAYFINFGRDVGWAGSPSQYYGYIKLGNTFEYSVGLILALQERLSMNFSLNQRITGKTTQDGTPLTDTAINAISFNIGATYVIPPPHRGGFGGGHRPEQGRAGCHGAGAGAHPV
jgi:hypothetical protein